MEEHARPEVGALGERDRRSGFNLREDERGNRGGPGREEEGFAALQLSKRALCLNAGRMRIALVVEVTRLAVAVRPDRGAVERHRDNSTFGFDAVRPLR